MFSSNVFHANTYGPSIDAPAYGTLTSFTSFHRNRNSGVRNNFTLNIIGLIIWASALLRAMRRPASSSGWVPAL